MAVAIEYSRRGGLQLPRDREDLRIEADGTFNLWRTVGGTTQPPTPIGHFSGQLDDSLNSTLQQHIKEAQLVEIPSLNLAPDTPVEVVSIEGRELALGTHDTPEGVWGILITYLRSLLVTLTNYPKAAIAIELSPDGQKAHLVHQGTEPLQLNLGSLKVRAVLWQDYDVIADWYAPTPTSRIPERVTATKDWALELPFQHGFEVKPEYRVVAYVTFEIYLDNDWVACSLESF